MITTTISESLIQLGISANDWESAIRIAAQPLVDANKIKPEYVDGIIRSVQTSGPYFVLAPQIALPHTRSEEGALEDAIGITVLNTPVEFGNEANDPVKYIFTLSAISSQNHLNALAKLAELFEDQAFFELLDRATDAKEVMAYLKGKEV